MEIFQKCFIYFEQGGFLLIPLSTISIFVFHDIFMIWFHLPTLSLTIKNLALKKIIQGQDQMATSLSKFQKRLQLSTALLAVAPLIGLLGTVLGMIYTFNALSGASGDTTRFMADGIREALITTQYGLLVALPGITAVHFLKRRVNRLTNRFQAICPIKGLTS